jgi:hypothetical protein
MVEFTGITVDRYEVTVANSADNVKASYLDAREQSQQDGQEQQQSESESDGDEEISFAEVVQMMQQMEM